MKSFWTAKREQKLGKVTVAYKLKETLVNQ